MSAMMEGDVQRIFDQLESIQAQLRSLVATTSANAVHIGERLMAVETWKMSHAEYDERMHTELDAELKEVAVQLGMQTGRLEDSLKVERVRVDGMERLHEQAKGAAIAWKVVGAGVGAVLMGFELWRAFGGTR